MRNDDLRGYIVLLPPPKSAVQVQQRRSHITHRTARNEAHHTAWRSLFCAFEARRGEFCPGVPCRTLWRGCLPSPVTGGVRATQVTHHTPHTAHRTHAQEGPHHTTTPRCALFVRLRARSWAMPRWCALLNNHWHIKHREHKTRNPVPPAKSESTALFPLHKPPVHCVFCVALVRLVLSSVAVTT